MIPVSTLVAVLMISYTHRYALAMPPVQDKNYSYITPIKPFSLESNYMSSNGFSRYLHRLAAGDWKRRDSVNTNLEAAPLRYDGLYVAKWDDKSSNYLRFFLGGGVGQASSTGTPSDVIKWLPNGASLTGRYKINGNSLGIILHIFDDNEPEFVGEITNETIELYGYLGRNPVFYGEYQFVKVPAE